MKNIIDTKMLVLLILVLTTIGCTNVEEKFYPDGSIKSTSELKDGIKHGMMKKYHPNGKLALEVNFVNGKREGIQKEYYKTGALKGEIEIKNNIKQGLVTRYDEDGALANVTEYKNDKKNGYAKWYRPNGVLDIEKYYENDSCISSLSLDTMGEETVGETRKAVMDYPDKIVLGKEHKFTFTVARPKTKTLLPMFAFRLATEDSTAEYVCDSTKMSIDTAHNSIHYLFTPKELGDWQFVSTIGYDNGYGLYEKVHWGSFTVVEE
ncbi:toxin-antitoxin system YwqK family antitoxin [bacterium]|nr:toxin-antitoxin system YwqK family antitoxin [bacterium]